MPVPRRKNLEPPRFEDQNWVNKDRIDAEFHKRRLSLAAFRYIGFERVFAGDRAGTGKPTWHFLWRPPRIEDDEASDIEWNPIRFLGQGTFGKVGLWRRIVGGEVVDEMAIKEADRPDDEDRDEVPNEFGISYDGLPTEAALNNDLNRQHPSEHICFLRNFKYYSESGDYGRYRFFFNYCPNDSLYTLATKYKMWDAWFPELFLWHVLIQLLKGIQHLENAPPDDTICDVPGRTKTCFLIHLDLKPDNILLDYGANEGGPDRSAHYPDVRIADFGVSQYTGIADDTNPHSIDAGTPGYKPPEQTYKHTRWGESFKRCPFDENRKWEKSHNLWAVGKIMFDIMTHQPHLLIDSLMCNTEEGDYKDNEQHFLPKDLADLWSPLSEYWMDKARKLVTEASGAYNNINAREGIADESSSPHPEHSKQLSGETPDDAGTSQEKVGVDQQEDEEDRKEREEEAEAERMAAQAAALRSSEHYEAMAAHWKSGKRPDSEAALRLAVAGRQKFIDSDSPPAPEAEGTKKVSRKKAPRAINGTSMRMPSPFQPSWKLYYRGNEINNMPPGPGAYEPDSDRYQRMVTKCDPDEPLLAPPQDKWQDYIRPLGPTPPMIDIYEGSRRIENPEVRLRNPAEASSQEAAQTSSPQQGSDLPTQAQYGQLRLTQLAQELVRRTGSENVVEEAKGVKATNNAEQLITRLRGLDRKGLRGRHPSEVVASTTVENPPRGSKRSSDDSTHDGDDPARPVKKSDKRKGKSRAISPDQPEREVMDSEGAVPLPAPRLNLQGEKRSGKTRKLLRNSVRKKKSDPSGPQAAMVGGDDTDEESKPIQPGRGRSAITKVHGQRHYGAQIPELVARGGDAGDDAHPKTEEQPPKRAPRAAKQKATAAIAKQGPNRRRGGGQHAVGAQRDDSRQDPLQGDDNEASDSGQHDGQKKPPPAKRKAGGKGKPAPKAPAEGVGKAKKTAAARRKVKTAKRGKGA